MNKLKFTLLGGGVGVIISWLLRPTSYYDKQVSLECHWLPYGCGYGEDTVSRYPKHHR